MLFMVIERFRDNDMLPVYERRHGRPFASRRSRHVDSWVEANFSRYFQLMRRDDLRLIQQLILQLGAALGLRLQVVPVVTNARPAPSSRPS